jgi:hypothetical protein
LLRSPCRVCSTGSGQCRFGNPQTLVACQREVPWPHNPVVWRNLSSLCTEIGQTMLTRMRAGMAAGEEIVGVRIAAAWEPYTACSAPVQATEGKES